MTQVAGTYLADAVICWTGAATGERVTILASNETVTADVFDYLAGGTSPAIQCNHVHQIMHLPIATRVWIEVIQDAGADRVVTTESRFSMERIAT